MLTLEILTRKLDAIEEYRALKRYFFCCEHKTYSLMGEFLFQVCLRDIFS